MKATNSIVEEKKEAPSFSAVISGEGAQKLIRASLRDDGAVKRFTGTLISVVNASEQLRNCKPGSIISAALRGEGAGLIYGQGYYVVPYGEVATYLTSAKGWCQLAIATGLYADIDVRDVREGERKGRDPRTGKTVIDWSVYDTDEEREQHDIIGVKAYFILKDGFYREEYWSMGEILRHANRYSTAFKLDLYEKWQKGESLTAYEARTVSNGSPWYTNTLRMAYKTVLKSLLTSGFAPLSNEVKSMLAAESESGEGVIPDSGGVAIPDAPDSSPAPVIPVDENGEVIGHIPQQQKAAEEPAPAQEKPVEQKKPAAEKKTRKAAEKAVDVEFFDGADDSDANEDFADSFFGD